MSEKITTGEQVCKEQFYSYSSVLLSNVFLWVEDKLAAEMQEGYVPITCHISPTGERWPEMTYRDTPPASWTVNLLLRKGDPIRN
jgi:hypothetical protein